MATTSLVSVCRALGVADCERPAARGLVATLDGAAESSVLPACFADVRFYEGLALVGEDAPVSAAGTPAHPHHARPLDAHLLPVRTALTDTPSSLALLSCCPHRPAAHSTSRLPPRLSTSRVWWRTACCWAWLTQWSSQTGHAACGCSSGQTDRRTSCSKQRRPQPEAAAAAADAVLVVPRVMQSVATPCSGSHTHFPNSQQHAGRAAEQQKPHTQQRRRRVPASCAANTICLPVRLRAHSPDHQVGTTT